MATHLQFAFRKGSPEIDYNYILKTWNMTWRREPAARSLPSAQYYSQSNTLFRAILERYGCIVVCNPRDPDQIYGFAVVAYLPNDEWVLFWIHIKSMYADLGIGTELFNYVKGNRPRGPFCPFVRGSMRKVLKRYDAVDTPMLTGKLLSMDTVTGVNNNE